MFTHNNKNIFYFTAKIKTMFSKKRFNYFLFIGYKCSKLFKIKIYVTKLVFIQQNLKFLLNVQIDVCVRTETGISVQLLQLVYNTFL